MRLKWGIKSFLRLRDDDVFNSTRKEYGSFAKEFGSVRKELESAEEEFGLAKLLSCRVAKDFGRLRLLSKSARFLCGSPKLLFR
jgi:hypothetical protein